jgi:hypothetical protein
MEIRFSKEAMTFNLIIVLKQKNSATIKTNVICAIGPSVNKDRKLFQMRTRRK